MKFKLDVKFTFNAKVEIEADTREEAIEIANSSFGCVSPNYHESDDRVIEWDGEVHPSEKTIE